MIYFSYSKLNLGLQIINKRSDGFHNLSSVFYPLHFEDIIEVIIDTSLKSSNIKLSLSGYSIPNSNHDNLITRAYRLVNKHHPTLPAIKVHLHKNIPLGSGLGGGSANASRMLQILNDKFCLNIAPPTLETWAAELGSDCCFFLQQRQPCFVAGRGENCQPIENFNLANYKIVLFFSNIHISTQEIFYKISLNKPHISIENIINQPIEEWKFQLKNDFEDVVFKIFPVLEGLKEAIYKLGAIYASMTGTGSCLYGIFDKNHIFNKEEFIHYHKGIEIKEVGVVS
ncbi:MAG: 4-(cytidine 5'-diphospho)-2-C-methyl-D-erythritol kinase [Alphaproteobacteria bacterium]|nr:4-(cytidine 5'-diphospho)-2-C-methyl-D-erythritol kinase [Alphaproteobacteria bacterium]